LQCIGNTVPDLRRPKGDAGERIAVSFLERLGYRIAARNFRLRTGEIDIVAWDDATLVFVEVKTKTQHKFGQPEEMVTRRKQLTLERVAMGYIQRHACEGTDIRFDVVAVQLEPHGAAEVTHIPAAFSPSTRFFY
jgi:putative endonuclease